MTLRSAVLDRTGTRHEERELDARVCDCCQTDAAQLPGRTIVVYRGRSASEVRDILLVARTPDGAWSTPRALHADNWRIEGCPVNGPAIAASGDRFLTVWPTQASGVSEVRYTVRSWEAPGRVHALDAGSGTLGRVDAAAWDAGYLVTWLGGNSGKEAGLQIAVIDASGKPIERRTAASVDATRLSGIPRLAARRDRALLAWIEPGEKNGGGRLAVALLAQ